MINLNTKKKYLLACSYGPDSMALFGMLLDKGYDFIVAHVNYNLRDESKGETENLTKFCNKHDIELFVHELDGKSLKGNLEAICREERYKFFKKVYDAENCDELLVAHHLNDHIETYLLQEQRGAFVSHYGLASLRHIFGMDVRRPLLTFTKADLLAYCKANSIPFSIDKTKLEDHYQRNKIRHSIIEKMSKEEMLQITEKISKKNKNIKNLEAFLENLDLNSVEVMSNLEDEIFLSALHKDLLLFLGEDNKNISISLMLAKEIKKALLSKKSNIEIDIGEDIKYVKAYDRCFFVVDKGISTYSYVLDKPGLLDTEYFYLDFTNGSGDKNISLDDYPITIRTAKPNDVFYIKDYKVLMRRAFIDWKMPLELRRKWPVIVNKNGVVVFVPRYKSDFVVTSDLNFYVKTNY